MSTLKELRSQHRNIIQMAFNGYKNNEIAERLGMTQSTVSIVLRSPLGQAYLNGLQDRAAEATLDVRKKLVSLNKDALAAIARILTPTEKAPHSVQLNAAKDVLDRNGYKAPDRLNIDMTLQTKTDEELDAEIEAIEASLRRKHNIKNLTEVTSLASKDSSISSPKIIDHTQRNNCSPSDVTITHSSSFQNEAVDLPNLEDELSLEDSTNEAGYTLEELASFEESNLDEQTSLEDTELLNNLSFDPFHNIQRC